MGIFLGILPDMGQYAVYIWSTYGVAMAGLLLLGVASWRKSRRLDMAVKKAEDAKKK